MKSLKGYKGNHVPAQLDHPSQRIAPVELDPIGHPFQRTDDSQRMSQVTFKAMGSEEAQLLTSPKVMKEKYL